MFLRDFAIHAGTSAEFPEGFESRDFNRSVSHISELLISFFPYRKLNFDNMSKLNVVFGRSHYEEYERHADGVAIYSDQDFSFFDYSGLTGSERETLVLDSVKYAFLRIEKITGFSAAEMINIANNVKAANFRRKIYRKKLARSTKSRQYRFHVYVEIFPYFEIWGVDVTNKVGEVVRSIKLQENKFFGISSIALHKTRWCESNLQILNYNNRVIHEIDTANLGFV